VKGDNGKYKTLLIDPPWHYGNWGKGSSLCLCPDIEPIPMSYKTMSVGEVSAMPISSLMDDNCDVYVWTTQKYLPVIFDVIKSWGLKYCQTLTWCKAPRGTGQGGLYCPTTEFLILARKGRMPLNKVRQDSTWWQVTRTKRHSEKPQHFHRLIEKQSDGPRLEMFAREAVAGWDSWGDEAVNPVELCFE